MLSDPPARQVKSVKTAFRLVTELQSLGSATLTELADDLDLATSTVHNYLATLESMGYVVQTDGKYRLGLHFLTHGEAAKRSLDCHDLVLDALPAIAADVSYPAWWVKEEMGHGVFLEKALPSERDVVYGRVGKRSYLHTHAPGKAILAGLPRAEAEAIVDYHGLPEQTARTTTERDELFRNLDTIRDRGVAVSSGEAVLGVQSIGVSFRSPNAEVNAIGVFAHLRDFAGKHAEEEIASQLKAAAASLEETLEAGEGA